MESLLEPGSAFRSSKDKLTCEQLFVKVHIILTPRRHLFYSLNLLCEDVTENATLELLIYIP